MSQDMTCRLLRVSIISVCVLTVCNTFSFVLCSVQDTFIMRLNIRRISSFVKSTFHFHTTQHSTPHKYFYHTFSQMKAERFLHGNYSYKDVCNLYINTIYEIGLLGLAWLPLVKKNLKCLALPIQR